MDSCQLTHKMHNSATNVRSPTPIKIRSLQIKKSHSSTPSPEIIASKMASSQVGMPPGDGQHAQNSPQSHSGNMTRSRVGHASSPLEHRQENIKRRRLNSSPVRPWKSPSPPTSSVSANVSESSANQPGPNLLRHISVIRETPPILKPQVMTPSPYHAHHYHHLVDQYAAAYHLYKTSPNGTPITPQTSTNQNSHSTHHWGAYS